MGLWMTAPMVAWMAYRGHTTAQNGEMAASMIISTILAATLTWSGAIDTAAGLAIQHAIMLPAMLGVMLWRYDEYTHVHHAWFQKLLMGPAFGALPARGSCLRGLDLGAESAGALKLAAIGGPGLG